MICKNTIKTLNCQIVNLKKNQLLMKGKTKMFK